MLVPKCSLLKPEHVTQQLQGHAIEKKSPHSKFIILNDTIPRYTLPRTSEEKTLFMQIIMSSNTLVWEKKKALWQRKIESCA